jgi:glycosyltransferase involved in cell wall biosynthesis
MKRRRNLKITLAIDIFILLLLISYKGYLALYESDFDSRNIESINAITSEQNDGSYSFVVLGNIRNSIDIFERKIIEKVNSDPTVSFVISTGNAVLNGSEDKYRILNRSLEKLDVPIILTAGENEVSRNGDEKFYKHFGPFYFSFEHNGSYFIFLDTTGKTSYQWQMAWLENELKFAEKLNNTFLFMNDAPFRIDSESVFNANLNYIEDSVFRGFLLEKIEKHPITAVFSNGPTIYDERVFNGVNYFISGGGGGGFLSQQPNSYFHHLVVNVAPDGITWEVIKEELPAKYTATRLLENIWIVIHSFFYINWINFVIVIVILALIAISIYIPASKEVDYYSHAIAHTASQLVKNPLNIAVFTNNYLPYVAGVPISIHRLSTALRKRGHNVIIFAPEYPGDHKEEEGVFRCKPLFHKKTGDYDFPIINVFSKEIDREFEKHDFDVIHVHHPFWMGKKGLKIGISKNIPVILTYHTRLELYAHYLPNFLFSRLIFKNIVSHKMIRRFSQKCDAVIAPTLSALSYLENIGVSRLKKVIPTGIDSEHYITSDDNAVMEIKGVYAPEGELLLCSVSRLSEEKNIYFLIDAIERVRDNTAIPFRTLIIGDGPVKDRLQTIIEEKNLSDIIVLKGKVEQYDIPKYYLASDIFVYSSMSETQGMVILEAMTGGCPVIAVQSSGIEDVIIDSFNGFKTDNNITEWSDRVIHLLENAEQRKEMSLNAFNYSKGFTVDIMSKKVEALYYKTIERKI